MHVTLPFAKSATVAEVKHSPHLPHSSVKHVSCGVSHSTQHSTRCKISPILLEGGKDDRVRLRSCRLTVLLPHAVLGVQGGIQLWPVAGNELLLVNVRCSMQYSAFKEGYSFNTLEEGGNDIRDSLRIRRNGDNIRIVSGKTTASVGANGAKVCMVSPQLPSAAPSCPICDRRTWLARSACMNIASLHGAGAGWLDVKIRHRSGGRSWAAMCVDMMEKRSCWQRSTCHEQE